MLGCEERKGKESTWGLGNPSRDGETEGTCPALSAPISLTHFSGLMSV